MKVIESEPQHYRFERPDKAILYIDNITELDNAKFVCFFGNSSAIYFEIDVKDVESYDTPDETITTISKQEGETIEIDCPLNVSDIFWTFNDQEIKFNSKNKFILDSGYQVSHSHLRFCVSNISLS